MVDAVSMRTSVAGPDCDQVLDCTHWQGPARPDGMDSMREFLRRAATCALVSTGLLNAAVAGDWLRPEVTVYGPLEPRFHYSGQYTPSTSSALGGVTNRGQGYHSGQLDYPCAICPVWLGYYGPQSYCQNISVPRAPGGFFGFRDTFEPVLRHNPAPYDATLSAISADGTPVPAAQARSLLPPRRRGVTVSAPVESAPVPIQPAIEE